MNFTVDVPVEVEVLVQGSEHHSHETIMSFSNIPELTGHGTLRISDDHKGWDVHFRCADEFPLDGFAFEKRVCIEMVEKHIRNRAWSMRDDDDND